MIELLELILFWVRKSILVEPSDPKWPVDIEFYAPRVVAA